VARFDAAGVARPSYGERAASALRGAGRPGFAFTPPWRGEEDPIEEKRMDCPECGEPVGPAEQTCQKCGHPLSYAPAEKGAHCAVCDAGIGAYTETCPHCGETGYPALRPRRGRKWKGSMPEGLPGQ
jgi:predicted amidophosphoribosyltransferase